MGDGPREYNEKIWIDKRVQTDFIEQHQSPRSITPAPRRLYNKSYIYDELRQLESPKITETLPFHFGRSIPSSEIISHHPATSFFPIFLEKLKLKDRKYLNVIPVSITQLLKIINQLYSDKFLASKDLISARLQGLPLFFYDSYINKYGLLNVAERKLKEICLSCVINKEKIHKIEIFSRFLGISEPFYTNDDLHFMFTVASQLVQNISNATCIKHEATIFKSLSKTDLGPALSTVEEIFQKKIDHSSLEEIKIQLKKLATEAEYFYENPSKTKDINFQIDCDIFYSIMIENYQKLKLNYQKKMIMENNIHQGLHYSLDYYNFIEFEKLVKTLKWKESISPEVFFNIWSTYIMEPEDVGPQKKVSLETIISELLRS